MPITQDRLLALIAIVDETISAKETQRVSIQQYVTEAIDAFYSSEDNQKNELTGRMLAYLQAISALVAEPIISLESIATLAREREHFRLRRNANIRSAKAMKNRRHVLEVNPYE